MAGFFMSKKPIGIFDSGIGGLTVAAAIKKSLPNEDFVYFGDTLHSPYGDKSKESLLRYTNAIVQFLNEFDCKAIVIACNTASALVYEELKNNYPKLLWINVIDPVCDFIAQLDNKEVGLIATRSTVSSNAYAEGLAKRNKAINLKSLATPLLAPLVEEGFGNTSVSKGVLEHYLSNDKLKGIQSLILGCTHYPILQSEIEGFYPENFHVVDSPVLVSSLLQNKLSEKSLLSNSTAKAQYHFYISEYSDAFKEIAIRFFGEEITLEQKKLNL